MAKKAKGQVEQILSELGVKIDQLIVDTKQARGDVKVEVDKKIVDLKKRKEILEADFEEYKEKNGDKWQDAKTHLTVALGELKKAVETLFSDSKK
jgi:hypothetical protein